MQRKAGHISATIVGALFLVGCSTTAGSRNHVAGTGSTTTGLSAHEINGTTSTAYAGLRVLGKINAPGNAWGTNVLLEVQVYEHEYSPTNEATTPGV